MDRIVLACLITLSFTRAYAETDSESHSFRVDYVEVKGNQRTSETVIRRAAGVRPGDHISPEQLEKIRQSVMNLRIFQDVAVSYYSTSPTSGITITVKEQWTLQTSWAGWNILVEGKPFFCHLPRPQPTK